MLENSANVVPPEGPGSEPSGEPARPDARLAKLLEQDRLWFYWLTILHERLEKAAPGDTHLEILEIARSHWLEARIALQKYLAGD